MLYIFYFNFMNVYDGLRYLIHSYQNDCILSCYFHRIPKQLFMKPLIILFHNYMYTVSLNNLNIILYAKNSLKFNLVLFAFVKCPILFAIIQIVGCTFIILKALQYIHVLPNYIFCIFYLGWLSCLVSFVWAHSICKEFREKIHGHTPCCPEYG